MTDETSKQLRVLHVVSAGALNATMQQCLLMPLLTRLPKTHVKTQVVSLSSGFTPAPVLRQNGVPVHDIPLSRKQFSFGAPGQLLDTAREFRPDIIQAWGHTAQLAALAVRARCNWEPALVWSETETMPLAKNAGFIERHKAKFAAKYSHKAERLTFTSEAAAAMHRRAGFHDARTTVVHAGLDPLRLKPDLALRRKVRQQWGAAPNATVIGMVAPFLPEFDHHTFIQGVGELIKTNPHVQVVLAGHGVQRGNAALMAMIGGGTMGTRTQLLSDWSDMSSFYNACDIAFSSARTDVGRMSLVMAMLCGVPCVATGMGAQGEVVGSFGVAIEPGSPAAVVRGIKRLIEMPADRRMFMAQSARKHALDHFTVTRSLQKYLQLYFDLADVRASAESVIPTPQIDSSIPVEQPVAAPTAPDASVLTSSSTVEWQDPDSLEVKSRAPVRAEARAPAKPATQEGDVLELFETNLANGSFGTPRSEERARGAVDEDEELLAMEELQAPAPTASSAAAPKDKPASADAPRQAAAGR